MIKPNFNDVNCFDYFDFETFWKEDIEPVITSYPARSILDYDLAQYVELKRKNYIDYALSRGLSTTEHNWHFIRGTLPIEYDSSDWRCGEKQLPAWHEYVCLGACHWLVNTMLYVAMTAYPNQDWRIVTSPEHSTVWDGEDTLFDLNYATMGVPVEECVSKTFLTGRTVMLDVGEYLVLGHDYYR